MENIKEKLDSFTWSFSRVKSFSECPRLFYLTYFCDTEEKEPNAFAGWGSLCHSLFERYLKGKLELFELADVYKNEYDDYVKTPFPYNKYVDLQESYYNRGLEIFETYQGLPDEYEFVASEQRIEEMIGRYKFQGYIDVLLRDKSDGRMIVQDFKSKKRFASKEEKAEYAKQLYLYSNYVKRVYGEYPKMLRFDMFRAGKFEDIPFNESDFHAANTWLIETIDKIYETKDFFAKCPQEMRGCDFFCTNLCEMSDICDE